MKKYIIIGANSAIAREVALLYAQEKASLFLVARTLEPLHLFKTELETQGAHQVNLYQLDVRHFDQHLAMIDAAFSTFETIDGVLIAHGTLPDQHHCQRQYSDTLKELETNGLSVLSLLTELANRFENQKKGTLAVITSVAGDRGRQSNYIYGSAKALVSTFLSGLRNRLASTGVHVIDIRPGFVDTPMTADFKKGALWASPQTVAKGIVKGIKSKKNVLYLPWFWWGIMSIICSIPESIFKKLKL
jgi:hypothetical protein